MTVLLVYFACKSEHFPYIIKSNTSNIYRNLSNECVLGTSDFDAQISSIKFWKGDENRRPVFKKTVLRNIDWCMHIVLFS